MYCKFPGYSTLLSHIDGSDGESQFQWRGTKSLSLKTYIELVIYQRVSILFSIAHCAL